MIINKVYFLVNCVCLNNNFKRDIYIGYTGMDITCVYTSFYGFICDSVRLLHVTSDVIRTIVVRRRPNRMLTYVIT